MGFKLNSSDIVDSNAVDYIEHDHVLLGKRGGHYVYATLLQRDGEWFLDIRNHFLKKGDSVTQETKKGVRIPLSWFTKIEGLLEDLDRRETHSDMV